MNIKVWSTALLILCLCPAAMAQKANRYLEKPLPQGWGKDASHAIPGDDNLFSGQIPPIDDKWWKAFDDPMLDSLITVASTQNYSVLSAMDRMDMAKSNLRIERGSFFPSISLDGGWARQQSSGNVNALPQSITGAYSASLNASWELDVFGSIRQRVKAQRETFMASKEEYTSIMVSLCAQIASAYIGLRELQQELSVVTHNCHTQAAVLNITEVRYKTGLVSKLDVSQAKSVYYIQYQSLHPTTGGRHQPIHHDARNLTRYLSPTYPPHIGEARQTARLHGTHRHRHSCRPAASPSRHPASRTPSQRTGGNAWRIPK